MSIRQLRHDNSQAVYTYSFRENLEKSVKNDGSQTLCELLAAAMRKSPQNFSFWQQLFTANPLLSAENIRLALHRLVCDSHRPVSPLRTASAQ